MISVSKFGNIDYGRFGNQLFQYSLAKILSFKHDCGFYLNPSRYFLDFFDSKSLSYQKLSADIKTKPYIETDPYRYDKNIYNKSNIDIIGFFQNLSYYDSYWHILNTELRPNKNKIAGARDYLKSKSKYTLDLDQTICIHIRRTDYTIFQSRYGFLSIKYYLYIIKNYIKNYKHIFIISDDISRVKQELSDVLLESNVHLVNTLDVYQDFYIMYLSRINIIANSTFSWWSAMLSSLNEEKEIYIPSPWINQTDPNNFLLDTHLINLYPESWNKVDSNTIQWNKLFV